MMDSFTSEPSSVSRGYHCFPNGGLPLANSSALYVYSTSSVLAASTISLSARVTGVSMIRALERPADDGACHDAGRNASCRGLWRIGIIELIGHASARRVMAGAMTCLDSGDSENASGLYVGGPDSDR